MAICSGENKEKFISAVTSGYVCRPDVFIYYVSDTLEYHIAGMMTQGIVNQLEVAHVSHGNGNITVFLPLYPEHLLFNPHICVPSVFKSGQLVGNSIFFYIFVEQ